MLDQKKKKKRLFVSELQSTTSYVIFVWDAVKKKKSLQKQDCPHWNSITVTD